MDLVLIRLVDMRFNGVFLDSQCRHMQPTSGSGLMRLVDMRFNGVFLDSQCRLM